MRDLRNALLNRRFRSKQRTSAPASEGVSTPPRFRATIRGMLRPLVIILLLALAVLQYRLWIGDGSLAEIHRLKQDKQELQSTLEQARARNEALRAEISNLKSGEKALSGRARSAIGMIKEGEKFYRTIEAQDTADDEAGDAADNDGNDDDR